jgi:hypothetical protein
MDRQEFWALVATVWDACGEAVTRASSGQVIRERFLARPAGRRPVPRCATSGTIKSA